MDGLIPTLQTKYSRTIINMADETLPRIEFTNESTQVDNHSRTYICVQGKTLEEAYEYFQKIRRGDGN